MNKQQIYRQYRFTEVDYKTTPYRFAVSIFDQSILDDSLEHLRNELGRLATMYNEYKRRNKSQRP